MKSKSGIHAFLMLAILLIITLAQGCAMFKKRPLLVPRELGDTLVEITDPKLLPRFEDDYNKDSLLRAIDNSLEYYKRVKSNPYEFNMTGFSHQNLEDTLRFFREGVTRYGNTSEFNDSIIKNFRVFQAVGKSYEGDVHFTGYGTPIYDGSLTPT